MKRYIRSNETDDWLRDYLSSKKYRVDGGDKSFKTDDPKEALTRWFQYSAKYPMDCAILVTSREDGVALLKTATPQLVEKLATLYDCPYKIDYLLDGIQEGINNGCK